jgi:tetratricopeptide (TPR) repeat protein
MNTSSPNEWGSRATLAMLAFLLVGVAFILWLLVPSKEQVLQRMVHDENLDGIARLMSRINPTRQKRNPALYDLVNLKLRRRELQNANPQGRLASSDTEHLLDETWEKYLIYGGDARFAKEIGLLLGTSGDPELTRKWLARLRNKMAPALLPETLRDGEQRALALNNPKAAAILMRARLATGKMTVPNLQQLVRTWRQANAPTEALRDLEHFTARNPIKWGGSGAALAEMRIILLRELNRNSEAFDCLQDNRKVLESRLGSRQFLELTAATAIQAGREMDVLPFFRQWVKQNPKDIQVWQWIGQLSAGARQFQEAIQAYQRLRKLCPDDPQTGQLLGQIHEWNNEPDKAFDIYRDLAIKGNEFAFDRLMSLNNGLYRDEEIINVLKHLVPERGAHPRRFALADLLIRMARYAEAEDQFRRQLQANPRDVYALERLAFFQRNRDELETARETYCRILAIDPRHLAARRNLAELQWLTGRYEIALQSLQDLSRDDANSNFFVQYISLARSLGRFDEAIEALERHIQAQKNVTEQDYLNLAYFYELVGCREKRRRLLEEGSQRNPGALRMLHLLAMDYAAKGNSRQALDCLRGRVSAASPPSLQQLQLELLLECNQIQEGLAFARAMTAAGVKPSVEITRLTARFYERGGDWPNAGRLYAKLHAENPSNPANVVDHCRALYHLGYSTQAERLLRTLVFDGRMDTIQAVAGMFSELQMYRESRQFLEAYCRDYGTGNAGIWSMLGDSRLALRNPAGARHAYRRAVLELLRNPGGIDAP